MVSVNDFSNWLLNPALAYVTSCFGAFLGLRCVALGRVYHGMGRAAWLSLAAISIGATGIWAMHFIAMLGFSVPGQQITYNMTITIASMLLAILVVGIGLFIVGYGNAGWSRLLTGGTIVGVGVNVMHYLGMAGMQMPGRTHYNPVLVAVSVVIAVVAGTASLWFGTRVRGVRAALVASVIMGIAVTGMHYTGMAALQVTSGPMAMMSGMPAPTFVVPLVVGLTLITFGIVMALSLARSEEEIAEDEMLKRRAWRPPPVTTGQSPSGESAPRSRSPHPR